MHTSSNVSRIIQSELPELLVTTASTLRRLAQFQRLPVRTTCNVSPDVSPSAPWLA